MGLATREAYGKALVELGKENENVVVLDADLSKSTKTADFKKVYPNRFINTGIAEQNLLGISAGLSKYGKIPFASTFAVFATGRAFEIIRNSICYPNMNVKIAATVVRLKSNWKKDNKPRVTTISCAKPMIVPKANCHSNLNQT